MYHDHTGLGSSLASNLRERVLTCQRLLNHVDTYGLLGRGTHRG
jgi:hypothetical protein